MRRFAVLNDANVLSGYRDIDLEEGEPTPSNCIEVPRECDLVPWKYKWNPAEKRFEPMLADVLGFTLMKQSETLRAILLGLEACAGLVEMPPETKAVLASFRKAESIRKVS